MKRVDKMNNKKKALVLGMARSGYEVAKLLVSKGYDVTINDINKEQQTEKIGELKSLGVKIILGDHPDDLLDSTYEVMVKNPGIKNDHKYVLRAQELDIPVINDIELAYLYFPSNITIIGVTGTNGKTTTATIVYEIIRASSKSVYLMGNIGYPACSFVSNLKDGDIVVMEISDHQLCNINNFKTNISILLNISEAHIDFHGSYDAYKNAKKKIFSHHTHDDIAILNIDNKEVMELTKDILSNKKYFSSHMSNKACCTINHGYICYNNNRIINVDKIKIKGIHNYENIMAAIIVSKELGISDDVIINVLTTFKGVEHRLEYVKTLNDREFYNDSKSTNVTSTKMALSSFNKPIILILGGLDRGHSFDDLKDSMIKVKCIVAYGEVKEKVKCFATQCHISCEVTDDLESATKKSYTLSKEGDIILLSPACASWDQFKDYEERGNKFKNYINNL
jgi:UDP-N-acetylmuramoylalanine--D-glutamate ligase